MWPRGRKKSEPQYCLWEALMLDLVDKYCKAAIINMFKELEENMLKEVKESTMTITHWVENINFSKTKWTFWTRKVWKLIQICTKELNRFELAEESANTKIDLQGFSNLRNRENSKWIKGRKPQRRVKPFRGPVYVSWEYKKKEIKKKND